MSDTDDRLARLREAAARAIYEACRQEAADSGRPVVPEPYERRDPAFRAQFEATIHKVCAADYRTTPEREHENWMRAYEAMGWKYGPVRDAAAKTHPDMVPFADLPETERQKDAVFLACCAVARDLLTDATQESAPAPVDAPTGDLDAEERWIRSIPYYREGDMAILIHQLDAARAEKAALLETEEGRLRRCEQALDAARAERDEWRKSAQIFHADAHGLAEPYMLLKAECARLRAELSDLRSFDFLVDGPAKVRSLEAECARLRESQGRLLEAAKCIYEEPCGPDDEPCDGCKLRSLMAAAESAETQKEGEHGQG